LQEGDETWLQSCAYWEGGPHEFMRRWLCSRRGLRCGMEEKGAYWGGGGVFSLVKKKKRAELLKDKRRENLYLAGPRRKDWIFSPQRHREEGGGGLSRRGGEFGRLFPSKRRNHEKRGEVSNWQKKKARRVLGESGEREPSPFSLGETSGACRCF